MPSTKLHRRLSAVGWQVIKISRRRCPANTHAHAAIPGLQLECRNGAQAGPAAQLTRRPSGLMLFGHPDYLRLGERLFRMRLLLQSWRRVYFDGDTTKIEHRPKTLALSSARSFLLPMQKQGLDSLIFGMCWWKFRFVESQ